MPAKKPLSKDKKAKAKKATGTAKKKSGGNQYAPKWTPEKIEELSQKMLESVRMPTCWSLCQVANDVEMLVPTLLDVVKRYPVASEAYSFVRQVLSARYSELGANGGGNANYVMKMIPYYNKLLYDFDLALLKDQEDTKANVRIREKRELGEKVDDGNGNVLDEFDEFLQWKAAKKGKA